MQNRIPTGPIFTAAVVTVIPRAAPIQNRKTQTAALPWISVRDADGLQSHYLQLYNVQSIPTFFLVGRDNALDKRDVQIKDLDAEIEALLGK